MAGQVKGRISAPQAAARQSLSSRLRQNSDLVAIVVMAMVGIVIALYLTTVHYAGTPLVCTTGGVVNCAAVTTSSYSLVPGTQIPITIPGALWFLVSGGLAAAAFRAALLQRSSLLRLALVHLLWGLVGLIFVLYLVYAEVVRLHYICEWCTAVHILTLLTFLTALLRLQRLAAPEEL